METKTKRIIDISKSLDLSHIGSCLSVLPILEDIYNNKAPEDKVFLSGAHSHLAHMVAQGFPDGKIVAYIKKYGIHCDRNAGCDFSGGSLGHLGIAVGYAIAHPEITVWAVITDGSSMEGSEMEALRIKHDLYLDNLRVLANLNGYTATKEIDKAAHAILLTAICPDISIVFTNNGEGFDGVQGHYRKAD